MQTNEGISQELYKSINVFKDPDLSLDIKREALQKLVSHIGSPQSAGLRKSIKKQLKQMPGIKAFFRKRYERHFATWENVNLFRGVFPSILAAEASAPHTKKVGYDHDGPAKMYRHLMTQVSPMDYPGLLWLGAIIKYCQRIFDFGGHEGITFYAFDSKLNFPTNLSWIVYDVPAVIESGEELARRRKESRLQFTSDLRKAEGCDLFYAAGSLQYSPRSLFEILCGLRVRPRHLFINKQPLTDQDAFVTLQSIGAAFCPYQIFNRSDFIRSIESLGYESVDSWVTPDLKCEIPFQNKYQDIRYYGYYYRLKKS